MNNVIKDMSSLETFTQWVADNVDHNLRTLDGIGTFYGMNIVVISSSTIRRSAILKSSKKVIQGKGIPVS